MAARPRTLPAAVAPVLVGTAAAVQWYGSLPRWGTIGIVFGCCLIGAGAGMAVRQHVTNRKAQLRGSVG